ncbi:hypothetical protein, partial [Mesorhizobium sp. M0684]|uniref:hypothetical protein n=1 Tax=Mesorhizobium sp. M0684 TaxID=2956986 RepID=UPI0033389E1E
AHQPASRGTLISPAPMPESAATKPSATPLPGTRSIRRIDLAEEATFHTRPASPIAMAFFSFATSIPANASL